MAIAESSKEPGYGEENISGPGSRQMTNIITFQLIKDIIETFCVYNMLFFIIFIMIFILGIAISV